MPKGPKLQAERTKSRDCVLGTALSHSKRQQAPSAPVWKTAVCSPSEMRDGDPAAKKFLELQQRQMSSPGTCWEPSYGTGMVRLTP